MRLLARCVIGVVCWIIGLRDIRYKWLAHYLLGTGSTMYIVDSALLDEAASKCAYASLEQLKEGVVVQQNSSGILFWLVGSWTAQLIQTSNGEVVRGVDRYDWHPNKPIGMAHYYGEEANEVIPGFTWWWSPTTFPGWLAKVTRSIWSASREYVDVGANGNSSISNGFWSFLGGTEFDTVIEFPVSMLEDCGWTGDNYYTYPAWVDDDDQDIDSDYGQCNECGKDLFYGESWFCEHCQELWTEHRDLTHELHDLGELDTPTSERGKGIHTRVAEIEGALGRS